MIHHRGTEDTEKSAELMNVSCAPCNFFDGRKNCVSFIFFLVFSVVDDPG